MMRAIQSIAVDDAGFRADGKQFEGLAINADRGGRPQRRRTQKKRETRQLSTTFSACNSTVIYSLLFLKSRKFSFLYNWLA